MAEEETVNWPKYGRRIVPWRQQPGAGSRADRMTSEIEVRLPPMIADSDCRLPAGLDADMEASLGRSPH